MIYKVEILETLRKVVKVEAESPAKAREIVSERWYNGDYVLGEDDFYDVEFEPFESYEQGADGV